MDSARMPAAFKPVGVVVGREIAGERADQPAAGERAGGGLEHGGLARSRRPHDIDREQPALEKMVAVVRRGPLIVRQDPLLHLDVARGWYRHIRTNRTSRHLHHDLIEHDFVPCVPAAAGRRM